MAGRLAAVLLAVVVPAVALPVPPAVAAGEELAPFQAARERSVPVRTVGSRHSWPTTVSVRSAKAADLRADWPAGSAEVDPEPAGRAPKQVGALPVKVAGSGKVRVDVLDRAASDRAAVRGVLVKISGQGGPLDLEIDTAPFRDAFGGDWANRLRVVALPDCALSTPEKTECRGTPLPSRTSGGKVSAQVDTAMATTFGLAAAGDGPTGNFGASSLAPSASWSSGSSSGDFSWSYPFSMPAVAADLAPTVALNYSSQSVDGRTATTNNQPSAIGEGFDYQPGHIERRYKPCGDDLGGNNGQTKTGDLCWASDNATMTLGGRGGELVPTDATGTHWRLRNDDGTRVERTTGSGNGDDDGETWVVTSPEGTRYHFGSRPANQSIFTVPVFGNNAGEPCNKPAFADSSCVQAYRWNLDYVVDPHDNAMSYHYAQETNHYARNQNTAAGTQYVRGGQLARIDYGLRHGVAATAPARVVFETVDRCLPGTTCGPTAPANAPDTPWDQHCAAGACPLTAPSFWTQKRLSKVVTETWNGTAYEPVDSWSLRQSYPSNGDGTRAGLWLDGITRTGHVGGTQSLPEVVFDGVQLANRVDEANGPLMNWWRIRSIRSEFGGTLTVTYADKECSTANLPTSPDANTKRCQPSLRPEGAGQKLEYFHKYVVTKVVQNANITGDLSTPVETEYQYLGTPAWRYDEEDGLVPAERKTWSQWRGYEKVRVKQGSTTEGNQTYAQTQYFRGMDGDKLAAGGRKTVTVTDSESVAVADQNRLAGMVRESVTYDGVKATPVTVSGSITDYWVSDPTATVVRPWATIEARHSGASRVRGRTLLSSGQWRRTETATTFGEYGIASRVDELGDVSTPDDDRCTRYTHTRNLDKWLLAFPSRVETVSVSCAATPARPADVLSDNRMYYDDATDPTTPPLRGKVTRTEEMSGWAGAAPTYVTMSTTSFDPFGRPAVAVDQGGAATTMGYVANAAGLVTKVTATNALGHVTTTELDRRGEVSAQSDANGKRTELESDPLGRTRKVWAPGRRKGIDSPNAEFGYELRVGKANVVTTKRLQHDGGYAETIELFDGLTRLRQTQLGSPAGGRTIADIIYNSQGKVVKRSNGYWNSSPAGTELTIADDAVVPAQTRTTYNGEGQVTAEAFHKLGVKQWETLTVDGGDRITVDPPEGGTATMTVNDARGNTVELHQFHGGAPTGAADVTRYGYDKAGRLTSVTDPSGNVWGYHFDVRGRQYRTEDPDRGVTTSTYNDRNELVSTEDEEGRKLFHSYDVLGRHTEVRQDSATGPLRTSWTYDSVAKGQLTSSTRHVGTAQYTSTVTGYSDLYRPTGAKVSIPSTEGALAGEYAVSSTYALNGLVSSTTLPAAGGLPSERLETGFDALSQPTSLVAKDAAGAVSYTYVRETKYTEFGEISQLSLGVQGKSVWLTKSYEEGTRRLARLVTDRETSGKTQGDMSFAYDHAGNVKRIADQPSSFTGVPSDYQCFRTDHLRRTTDAWTPADGDCAPAPTAAKLGGPAKYWSAFGFDKTGNRTAETTFTAAGKTTKEYKYPATGQTHTLTSVNVTNPNGTTRTDSFAYDKTGNTTARPGQTLEWDPEGKLAQVKVGTQTTSFLYDADGTRLLRRDPTGTTLYVAGMELRLAGSTVTGKRFYGHAGEAVAMRTGSTVHWLSGDQHGTVSLAIKADDLSVTRRRFQPFGEERGPVVSWPSDHGFLDAPKDQSTGLTHIGARDYDTVNGRFVSADPIVDNGDPQQMNGYAYSNNNPTTFTDPTGLRATCDNGDGVSDKGCGVPVLTPAQQAENNQTVTLNRAQSDLQKKKDELAKAQATSKKNALIEALKKVDLLELLLDLTGVSDFRDCFSKGDVGACIGVITNFIPVAKLGRLVMKLGTVLTKAFKVFRGVQKAIEHAGKAIGRLADDVLAAEGHVSALSIRSKRSTPAVFDPKGGTDDYVGKHRGKGGAHAANGEMPKHIRSEATPSKHGRNSPVTAHTWKYHEGIQMGIDFVDGYNKSHPIVKILPKDWQPYGDAVVGLVDMINKKRSRSK